MKHVAVDELTSDADERGVERRRLSERLGTTDIAINHYRIAPGRGLPSGLHAHADQEEVFAVLDGTATFETLVSRDGSATTSDEQEGTAGGDREGAVSDDRVAATVTIAAGAAVRFAPGEFQSGRNDGDDTLVVLAIGAPRDGEDLRFPVRCPDCDHGSIRLVTTDGPRFVCPNCGAERVPTACPDCGGEDLRFRLADGARRSIDDTHPDDARLDDGPRTVVRCVTCAATFETPLVRGTW